MSEELSCKGKPHKIVLRIFFPPQSRHPIFDKEQIFIFSMSHFTALPLASGSIYVTALIPACTRRMHGTCFTSTAV